MAETGGLKRSFPPRSLEERPHKDHRRDANQRGPLKSAMNDDNNSEIRARREHQNFAKEQTRLNQIQEAEQMREWVSKEDEFVLKQSKRKAYIRVREGRARTIDWLAVTLGVLDSEQDLLEDDEDDTDAEVVDPTGVFEGLNLSQLRDLEEEIDTYLALEVKARNRKYWSALKAICKESQSRLAPSAKPHGRSSNVVSADVDRLLSPKNLKDLEGIEVQIKQKLRSDEAIDVEYWENLLQNVGIYKSRAELNSMYKAIIQSRLDNLRQQELEEAAAEKDQLETVLHGLFESSAENTEDATPPKYARTNDPEPMLRLRPEDKSLELLDESDFLTKIKSDRRRVQKLGYVPLKQASSSRSKQPVATKPQEVSAPAVPRFAQTPNEDFSTATTALYEREVARGVQDNEEIFAGEEEVVTKSKSQWSGKYRPRKPRYFNRVQMGYEWNKYNQTHYDHDNPPPKVVQGYKFNIFYPDLIDKTKAPTYRLEREGGRRCGESSAPAGEEDTCLIRFVSGPPYEDVAFRILDKKWDLSAQRERGFKSSFDKGILQLHFQFKKVFYRK